MAPDHHPPSAIVARYDADAAAYARYWAPVLEQTARRLLETVDGTLARLGADSPAELRVLDVGAGTGSLAFAALERWPHSRVLVSDAAAGMLEFARSRAPGAVADDRLDFVHGPADRLPIADRAIDVALSSFVLQLVPDRPAALREIHRVLRPGGLLAYVTWLDRDSREPFRAADEFDEAVYDLKIEEPEHAEEVHAGDVRSARAAADELRRTGFVRASALEEELTYEWTLESYLEYKLAYDERSLVSWLDAQQRTELERNARRRLTALAPSEFRWHAPVVFARGVKPDR